MSLKPITNNVDALNNKSLNLYANSVTANTITGAGTIDLTNIECETITSTVQGTFNKLTTTGLTTLNNNIIPSGTSTAGYFLENTDGAGTLQWASPSAGVLIKSGTYAPTVTVGQGGSLITTNIFNYTLIGKVLNFSGSFGIISPPSGDYVTVQISLPLGRQPVNASVYINGTGGNSTLALPSSNMISIRSFAGIAPNDVEITFSLSSGIAFPSALNNLLCIVNGQCELI